MFDKFPKARPILTEEYQELYVEHYKSNRSGDSPASNVAQKLERWMHKRVADDVNFDHDEVTLEIGAGTLNQLQYESPEIYDIVEPFKELYKEKEDFRKVRKSYDDINEISIDQKYDRIISIATFEHITNLPNVVAKGCLLMKDNATLRTAIPNEGHLAWKLGWKFSTAIEFYLKYGLDYGKIMNYEHVNTADEIEEILDYFFEQNKCNFFGLTKSLSFYRFYESAKPRMERVNKFMSKSN